MVWGSLALPGTIAALLVSGTIAASKSAAPSPTTSAAADSEKPGCLDSSSRLASTRTASAAALAGGTGASSTRSSLSPNPLPNSRQARDMPLPPSYPSLYYLSASRASSGEVHPTVSVGELQLLREKLSRVAPRNAVEKGVSDGELRLLQQKLERVVGVSAVAARASLLSYGSYGSTSVSQGRRQPGESGSPTQSEKGKRRDGSHAGDAITSTSSRTSSRVSSPGRILESDVDIDVDHQRSEAQTEIIVAESPLWSDGGGLEDWPNSSSATSMELEPGDRPQDDAKFSRQRTAESSAASTVATHRNKRNKPPAPQYLPHTRLVESGRIEASSDARLSSKDTVTPIIQPEASLPGQSSINKVLITGSETTQARAQRVRRRLRPSVLLAAASAAAAGGRLLRGATPSPILSCHKSRRNYLGVPWPAN